MAKESPTWSVTIDDSSDAARAITNDVTNLSISTPRGIQDVTGVNSAGVERLLLVADGTISLNGVFNDAATTGAHTVLSTASTTTQDRDCVLVASGQTMTMAAVHPNYELTAAQDRSLTWAVNMLQTSTTAPTWS